MRHNPNCDGSYCTTATGEVRKYPLGGGANLILCSSCWAHENRYRDKRRRDTGNVKEWPREDWSQAPNIHRMKNVVKTLTFTGRIHGALRDIESNKGQKLLWDVLSEYAGEYVELTISVLGRCRACGLPEGLEGECVPPYLTP